MEGDQKKGAAHRLYQLGDRQMVSHPWPGNPTEFTQSTPENSRQVSLCKDRIVKTPLMLEIVLRSTRAERLFIEARPTERPNESAPIPTVTPDMAPSDQTQAREAHHSFLDRAQLQYR